MRIENDVTKRIMNVEVSTIAQEDMKAKRRRDWEQRAQTGGMQEGSRASGQGRDGMGLRAGSRRVVDGTRDRDGRSRQREMNQSSLMPCPVLRNA